MHVVLERVGGVFAVRAEEGPAGGRGVAGGTGAGFFGPDGAQDVRRVRNAWFAEEVDCVCRPDPCGVEDGVVGLWEGAEDWRSLTVVRRRRCRGGRCG